MTIETNCPEETFALGQKLGEQAKAGQIYTLNGDLGVGKTVFTQGIARGLGITEAHRIFYSIIDGPLFLKSELWSSWGFRRFHRNRTC